jgi:putative mRNA 3-end processing factor
MLLTLTDHGLYCAAGDFFIDPWRPVGRAVITHAHGDHARPGSAAYLCAAPGAHILRLRLGADARIDSLRYGEVVSMHGVRVSLHPAGHILGSAQARIERDGEVWVVSGDYKTAPDPTCQPFEVVPCHTFISEATFGLPIYRWPPASEVFAAIDAWRRENAAAGRASILFAYALGKAQRILAGVDPSIGPVFAHGAVHSLNLAYRHSGVALPEWRYAGDAAAGTDWSRALILAPTSAQGTPWLRRFGDQSAAFASGWMRVRGQRRRRAVDRGFVLSDHVDWPGLMDTIAATGASRVLVTHGYTAVVARFLRERGIEAYELDTPYSGEALNEEANEPVEAPPGGEYDTLPDKTRRDR